MRILLVLVVLFSLAGAVDQFWRTPTLLAVPFLGALCWLMLGRLTAQERRIALLEQRLQSTSFIPDQATAPVPPAAPADAASARPTSPSATPESFIFSEAPESPPLGMHKPLPDPGPNPAQRLWTTVRAWLLDGNPVVKAGLLVLFFGVSFLLKYAAEHSLLPVELRLAGAGLLGITLLGIGWRLRLRQTLYALLLQGGGVGVLYLTLFAATRLLDLLPPGAGLLLLTLVVIFSGMLAVLQNASGLAVFGTAGGFLAPVLLASGQGNHVHLFLYYALLNAGVLGVAWFRTWRVLTLLGFAFTFGIAAAWGALQYQPEHFATTEPFLILFFLMYAVISILFARDAASRLEVRLDSALVFGLPLAAFGLQMGMVSTMDLIPAFSCLALASWYLGSLTVFRHSQGLRLLAETHLVLGVIFISLAVPMALDATWTASTWALEGAAMVWLGLRQDRIITRMLGLCLQLGAAISFLLAPSAMHLAPDFGHLLAGLFLAVGGLTAGWCCWTWAPRLHPLENMAHAAYGVWGLVWWYGTWLLWIDGTGGELAHLQALLLILASMGSWFALARRTSWPVPSLAVPLALPLLGLLALGWHGHPAANWGWVAWPGAMLGWMLTLRAMEPRWNAALTSWLHSGSLQIPLLLLVREAPWQADLLLDSSAWTNAALGTSLMLLLLWPTLATRPRWPIVPHRAAYLRGALTVACGLALWWIGACAQPGDPRPLGYIPVLNPLELSQLLAVTAILAWLRALATSELPVPKMSRMLPGGLFFVWLNTVTARSVHFYADVPYTPQALFHSPVLQAACAVLWTVAALCAMLLGRHTAHRKVWIAGAVLLAVVVAKLFLLDLAGQGSVARIVAFLGVGLLMLVIGYFCPVPPKEES